MIALFTLLTIILLSITVIRIGAIALELTGVSAEIASFQAQSAFCAAGFTTSESETVVAHPVRRRIVRVLILLGSAGITTSMATLVLAFINESTRDILRRGGILLVGILILLLFSRSKQVYVVMRRLISRALKRWTNMHIYDYEQLLGLSEGYTISRLKLKHNSHLADKKLSELKLEQEGVLILAIYRKIHRKECFIGRLSGDTMIEPADTLICYSHQEVASSLLEKHGSV